MSDLTELVAAYTSISDRVLAAERRLQQWTPDHFAVESVQPGVIMAERLNDPTRYTLWARNPSPNRFEFDPHYDAARWITRQGEFSIPVGDQFRIPFARSVGIGQNLWVQWEARFDQRWQQGAKTFQIADDRNPRNGGEIQLEINSFACARSNNGPASMGDYQITPAIRFYRPAMQPVSRMIGKLRNVQTAMFGLTGSQLAKADPPMRHVGEGGTQYFVRPGQWTRYTVHYDMTTWRLQMWIADESTDPTMVIDSPVQMNEPTIRRFIAWWVELNSSEGRVPAPCDCFTWVRNAIASTSPIALGGRPG